MHQDVAKLAKKAYIKNRLPTPTAILSANFRNNYGRTKSYELLGQ